MIALLYDIHGNLPALEAVLEDAEERGARRWLIGGDVSAFGGWPAGTVELLGGLQDAAWLRGNWERWTFDGRAIPANPLLHAVADVVRQQLGDDRVTALGGLRESIALSTDPSGPTRAWHGSPVSDVRSFGSTPDEDEAELLAGVTERRLLFGHTHVQFRRIALRGDDDPVELVNPGSVGLPFDGDRRAAYAMLHPDGRIELHRIPYDVEQAVEGVLALALGAPWGGFVAQALRDASFPA
jgi:predicted phosphodiesterase